MKLSLIFAKVSYLHGLLNPDWVDGNPGQPGPLAQISEAAADLLLSQQVRALASHLQDEGVGERLSAVGKSFAAHALDRMSESLDDEGDDICPPYYIGPHIPHPWEWAALNPQPLPPKAYAPGAMRDMLIAISLRQIAGLTTSRRFNEEIQAVGQEIVAASASRIFDDYCGTFVPPRIGPHRGEN